MVGTLYTTPASCIPPKPLTDHCIVLDLDSTLVSTQEDHDMVHAPEIMTNPHLMELRNRTYYFRSVGLGKVGQNLTYPSWGITRPHLKEFLLFCFTYFKVVAVWSAGSKPYVEDIIDRIFVGQHLPMPHITFTKEDIVATDYSPVEKPLAKMAREHQQLVLHHTFAIDDRDDTMIHNPDNGIIIPAYEPESECTMEWLQEGDQALLQLKYWFLQPEVMQARDITTLDKKYIFENTVEQYKYRLSQLGL